MKGLPSILTLLILAATCLATVGCYTEDPNYGRKIYEPAGSPGSYNRDGRYYIPRDDRNHQWDYYDRGNQRHQWDNRNYREDWR